MAPVPDASRDDLPQAGSPSGSSISRGRDYVLSLVVDAAPLIKGTPLAHLASRFITIPEVLREIRDRQARQSLAQLPFELETRVPSEESLSAVLAFSKLTGDFASLSATDLKVLALTWMLEKEVNGTTHLRNTLTASPTATGSATSRRPRRRTKKKSSVLKEGDDRVGLIESAPEDVKSSEQSTKIHVASAQDDSISRIIVEQDEQCSSETKSKLNSGIVEDQIDEFRHDQLVLGVPDAERCSGSTQPVDGKSRPSQLDDVCVSISKGSPTCFRSINSNLNRPATIASDPCTPVPSEEGNWITPSRRGRKKQLKGAELGDDDGWITPQNIHRQKARQIFGDQKITPRAPETIPVACITSDFAMQNVLLQMGLRLLSVDGLAITNIKNFVLRCHACYKVTKDMDKKFCPSCGNNTLIRTTVGVDSSGNVTYYLKKNFQYNIRGTKYNIPQSKGGRNSNDIVLREDQREYQRALAYQRRAKTSTDPFSLDYDPMDIPKSKPRHALIPTIGHGKKNVNEGKKSRQKRR